jgi:hypothetical protein
MTQSDLPYLKMKLVPLDEFTDSSSSASKYRRQLEKQIRKADSKVTAMANVLPYVTNPTLHKGSNKKAIVALQNAHMRRYKELERQRLLEQHQPLPMPPPPPSPFPQAQSQVQLPEDRPPITSLVIPKRFNAKYSKLLNYLIDHPGQVSSTDSGELVIDGHTIRGTNYASAFRSLYLDYKQPAPGSRELVHKLKSLGVPKDVVSSKFAKTLFGQIGSGKKRVHVLRVY